MDNSCTDIYYRGECVSLCMDIHRGVSRLILMGRYVKVDKG
jgi:hypothetical protein